MFSRIRDERHHKHRLHAIHKTDTRNPFRCVVVTFMMVYIALYDAYDARKHRYSRCFARASNTGYKSAGRLGYETREGGWLWEGVDHIYVYIYTVCTDITVNGFTHTRRCHEYDIYFADT